MENKLSEADRILASTVYWLGASLWVEVQPFPVGKEIVWASTSCCSTEIVSRTRMCAVEVTIIKRFSKQ